MSKPRLQATARVPLLAVGATSISASAHHDRKQCCAARNLKQQCLGARFVNTFGKAVSLPSSGTRWIAFAAVFALLCGCSGEGKVAVSGSVTVAGQPIDQGTIRFAPADGHGPTDGAAITGGKYHVELISGSKKVHIEGHQQVGTEKQNPADPSSPMLPVYESIVNANVTADISAGRDDLDFDLPLP